MKAFHCGGVQPLKGKSLQDTLRDIGNRFSSFFLQAMIIETEMRIKCPKEYKNNCVKMQKNKSNWGKSWKDNQFVVYLRGYRFTLQAWKIFWKTYAVVRIWLSTGNRTMPHGMLNLYPECIFFIKNQEQFPHCSYIILHKKAKKNMSMHINS